MKLTADHVNGFAKGYWIGSEMDRSRDISGNPLAAVPNKMPARKRLNHRGPLSIDVSSALPIEVNLMNDGSFAEGRTNCGIIYSMKR